MTNNTNAFEIPLIDWVEEMELLPDTFTFSYEHDMFIDDDDEGEMLVVSSPDGHLLVLWEEIVDWTTDDQLLLKEYPNRRAMLDDLAENERYVSTRESLSSAVNDWVERYS